MQWRARRVCPFVICVGPISINVEKPPKLKIPTEISQSAVGSRATSHHNNNHASSLWYRVALLDDSTPLSCVSAIATRPVS